MKKAKRFLTCLLCFALVFVMGGGGIFSAFSLTASAAETTFDINTSSPLDDLQGATIEGTPFSTEAFNADTVEVPFILNFLEYRYGSEEFSLYFYLLIPKGTTIWDTTVLSYVSLQFGEADNAEVYKLPARYLTEAEDPTHNGRYLKFKVELSESQKSLFSSRIDKNSDF